MTDSDLITNPAAVERYRDFMGHLLKDTGHPVLATQSQAEPAMWCFEGTGASAIAEIGYHDGEVMLKGLFVLPEMCSTGFGTEVMNLICACADKAGIAIEITVTPFAYLPDSTAHRLQDWYGRMGFKGIAEPGDRRMRRAPKEEAHV